MPEIGKIYSLSKSFVSCSHLIWAMLALIGKVAERFRGMLYFRNLLIIIINLLSIKNIIIINITRPWPAFGRHGLAGSSGGDQSGRINSSHSIIEELDGIIGW